MIHNDTYINNSGTGSFSRDLEITGSNLSPANSASSPGSPHTNLLVLVGQVVATEIVERGDLASGGGEVLGASSGCQAVRVAADLSNL